MAHFLGLLLIVWSATTLIWASNGYDGFDALIKLVILAQVFVLGSYLNSLRYVFIGLALGLGVSSFLVISDYDGGLFVNPNIMSEAAVMVGVGLCIYKIWWLVPLILPAIFWNAAVHPETYSTRAAIFTLIIMLLLWLWNRSRLIFALIFFPLLIGIASLYFDYKVSSVNERLVLWGDTLTGVSLLGHGLGSFFTSYPFYSELDTLFERPRYAHNDLLQITFELGLIGLLITVGFITTILLSSGKEKYVFLSFLIISLFSFPLYVPVSAFIAALVAGHTTRERFNLCF